MTFKSFDERLENWGRVVRPYGNSEPSEVCATWARWCVLLRDIKRGMSSRPVNPNILDAWVVERAWQALPNHVAKWALKYHYVDNMGHDHIRKAMWRDHDLRVRSHHIDGMLNTARQKLSREIVVITGESVFGAALTVVENSCKREELFI